ncbi:MAG: nucleotidyl transferase AbiEii/AbiGii toxin family protein [Micromonosporaceae bacterium]
MTRELGVDYLVVGAAARDLVLWFGYGGAVGRATADLDVAVAVASWQTYESLTSRFPHRTGDPAHRLRITGMPVDIVPFGGVERPDRTIAWPPDGHSVMSTFGMAEALADAIEVRLDTDLRCKVASLPAQVILKLTAWGERGVDRPRHDSADIAVLLRSYSEDWNLDRLYGDAALLEQFDFDAELAGAALLGRDVARLVGTGGGRLVSLLSGDLNGAGLLPYDMPGRTDQNRARRAAFLRGLISG